MIANCTSIFIEVYTTLKNFSHIDIHRAALVLCRHFNDIRFGTIDQSVINDLHPICCDQRSYHVGYHLCQDVLQPTTYEMHHICPSLEEESPLKQYELLTYVLLGILLPLGLLGNFTVLYAILKLQCLPRQTGNFLTSLAFADLGVMLQYVFWFICIQARISLSKTVDLYFHPSTDMFFSALVLLQITAISIERAVAVTRPLKYPSLVSPKRSKLIVYIIWSVGLFFFLFSMSRIFIPAHSYTNCVFVVAAIVLLVFPISTIVVCYSMVLVCAYKNLSEDRKRLRMLAVFLKRTYDNNGQDNDSSSDSSSYDDNLKYRHNNIRCREIRLAINVAMVVLPFLGCWGFFLFINVYEVLNDYYFLGIINWLMSILPFMVSCLNPILYLVFTRSLRKAVKSLIKRKMKAKLSRTEVSIMTVGSNNIIFGNNNNGSASRKVSTVIGRKLMRDQSREMETLQEQLLTLEKEKEQVCTTSID
ncbi:trace amine-associated receptor 9-like [Clytia hemisphaerica]|uniref:trace amine-associated receptor 9-like n=1 Tax=Clytia hemisphaerica TaxID=252671 RepID=UPI0034D4CBC0|eukprot:TCONS_00054700-protein